MDTAILICGVLTARAYFADATINTLATALYERVNWPWMLNGGATFAQAWYPGTGFASARYDTYCELMMLYFLAIGSPTFPVAPSYWNNFARPLLSYAGYTYISSNSDPLFTHQYSHAWFDFRSKSDAYANYFTNSIAATQAHESFCLAYPSVENAWYNENYWGITSSDYVGGFAAWGGPPAEGPIDGSVVPCAAAGSLAFLPNECLTMLENLQVNWGSQAWGRYGFVDAFHPAANWYCSEVLGIDQGISVLMAENLRTGLIWNTFMSNPSARRQCNSRDSKLRIDGSKSHGFERIGGRGCRKEALRCRGTSSPADVHAVQQRMALRVRGNAAGKLPARAYPASRHC